MEHRAIVDVVCKSAVQNLAGEIGTLLGQELQCTDIQLRLTSKEAFFSEIIREKTALTRMTVSGDQEGDCYLLSRIDSAIYLGGTLIMLPEDMIEENVQTGTLEGELEDAFGEVANIIAGVFTQAFVDKYPKTIRFVKKTVEELVPTKIDAASDHPFPPGTYYIASCTLKAEETDLGPVEFVVPAPLFGLEELPPAAEAPSKTAAEDTLATAPAPRPEPEQTAASAETNAWPAEAPAWPAEPSSPAAAESAVVEPPSPAKQPQPSFADAKKLTDVIFNASIRQIGEEIGALIGQDLKCDDIQLTMISKADFFANHCQEKSILTHMKVSGDREGLGFLILQIPDAIILGGTLIMLPEDQIEEQAQKNQYEGEVADAFGEVANILAGGLTQVFLERYPKQLRFIKTEAETLIPTKIDLTSDQPFPEGSYYLVSFAIHTEGYELHRMQLLFPAGTFDLDADQTAAEVGTPAPEPVQAAVTPAPTAAPATHQPDPAPVAPAATTARTEPVVLIISEQPAAAEPFLKILFSAEHGCKVLSYQDDIRQVFQQHQVLGVFLVMAQVGEKGFAAAIKLLSTGCPVPPLIFAGPDWTRSAVLRAIKYGARDIILIPASTDEIQEKASQHFLNAG